MTLARSMPTGMAEPCRADICIPIRLIMIVLLGFCTNPVRWRKRPQDQALVSFALVCAYVSSFLHDCFNVFFVVVGCRSSVLSISAR